MTTDDELSDAEVMEILVSAAVAGDIMRTLASDRGLRNYWTRGAGAAKIRWGTDGSFSRCVRHLGKYVTRPQGLCAEYHKEATGEWPAEKGIESAMNKPLVAHGSHNQKDHGNWADDDVDVDIEVGEYGGDSPKEAKRRKALRDEEDVLFPPHEPSTGSEYDGPDYLPKPKTSRKWWPSKGKKDYKGPAGEYDFSTKDDDDDTSGAGVPWEGVLVVEGSESGDGRMFALGSLDWAQLPLPLMYQPANVGGHNSSIMVGEITNAARRKNQVYGWGHVYAEALTSEHGTGIRQMIGTKDKPAAGGVSVDVDKVKNADVEYVYADGDDMGFMSQPETTIFNRGRIRGATLVAFPAFVEAKLAFSSDPLTSSADCGCTDEPQVLVAAGHTITIPDLPRREWFAKPTDARMLGALTVTDEGRVFGRLAPAGVTHRSVKRQVPMKTVDYSRWMNKETIIEGGERVVTGVITMNCGHAATENYGTLLNRKQHYDNSCSIVANVRIGEDADGVWVAGALKHGVSSEQVATMMGCQLSGDWQPHPDRPGVSEFIAALLVPVPGFPMARAQASVQYQDGVMVASAVPVVFGAQPQDQTAQRALANERRMLAADMGIDLASTRREYALQLGLE